MWILVERRYVIYTAAYSAQASDVLFADGKRECDGVMGVCGFVGHRVRGPAECRRGKAEGLGYFIPRLLRHGHRWDLAAATAGHTGGTELRSGKANSEDFSCSL